MIQVPRCTRGDAAVAGSEICKFMPSRLNFLQELLGDTEVYVYNSIKEIRRNWFLYCQDGVNDLEEIWALPIRAMKHSGSRTGAYQPGFCCEADTIVIAMALK